MRLLMLDDDFDLRGDIADAFRRRGLEVVDVLNGHEALAAIESSQPFDVVISDYDFGMADTRNGVEICTELRPLCGPDTRFIIFSGLDRAVPDWATLWSKGDILELINEVAS
jgi:CheY-like chemotaxis protein